MCCVVYDIVFFGVVIMMFFGDFISIMGVVNCLMGLLLLCCVLVGLVVF